MPFLGEAPVYPSNPISNSIDKLIIEGPNKIEVQPSVTTDNLPAFLRNYKDYKKYYADKYPAFIPYNALIQYHTNSRINKNQPNYGTVTPGTYYPKLTYLLEYGTGWPSKELPYLRGHN